MRRLLLTVTGLFCINLVEAQTLTFYREDMEFTIKNDTFYVNGLYYYRNTDTVPVKQVLWYPYPDNPSMGEVGRIEAWNFNVDTGKDLILSAEQTLAYIGLDVPALDTAILQVRYAQKILGNQAEYIIITTKTWGRPMDIANYILRVPDDQYIIDSLSYKPDTCFYPEGVTVYVFIKENFMPEKNVIVYFKRVE
jgi:hypothetical protein